LTPAGRVSGVPESAGDRLEARPTVRLDAVLIGETQSRVIITCAAIDAVKLLERAKLMGVPAVRLGTIGGDQLVIKAGSVELVWPVNELHDLWWNSIARIMA
jgi:phosphoribosylformylglycinamidine synthase